MNRGNLLWTVPEDAKALLILAHGAGAGPDSQFMTYMAEALGGYGIAVLRFEFPYWSKVRESGKKRPPDRAPVLDQSFQEVAAHAAERFSHLPLWFGGKSMGSRVALRCSQGSDAQGWVGFGFPFHPPGKAQRHRLDELTDLPARSLIIQGSKDPFGNQDWVTEHLRKKQIQPLIHWVERAGHDLHPPKSTGISPESAWQAQAGLVADYIQEDK